MIQKSNKKLVSVIVVTRDRKKDLNKCLESIYSSNYKNFEVLVIDNGSKKPVDKWIKKIFPKVRVIRADKNFGAAGGRNLGIKYAQGSYLLFIDDDAFVHENLINELVKGLEKSKEIGVVHPKIYFRENKNILQGLGCDINMLTARVSAVGLREKDYGQYDKEREIQTVGCIWMVKKEVIEKIGGYDEDFFIPYEDTDFSLRAKKAGFKIMFLPQALAWHRGPKKTYVNPVIDYLGIRSTDRAYRISRNKIIFMRKNAPRLNFIFFILILTPLYLVIHSSLIVSTGRFDILKKYWLGFVSGVWFSIKYHNPILDFYQNIDKKLINIKFQMMVWTDPICLVIDKSAKSVLDVGCGLGVPMELIKKKVRIDYAVGVDLFEPYIELLNEKKIHDKYILADVRKINFPKKSFDVVFASDVIEHMPKKDAWKVLEDMERFAKKQVIVTTSLGYLYHPPVDGNKLQLHLSGYQPEEFHKKGYKTIKYGTKQILGTDGLVHRIKFDPLKKLVFLTTFLLFHLYLIFPNLGNYCFVAYKDIIKTDE